MQKSRPIVIYIIKLVIRLKRQMYHLRQHIIVTLAPM